MSLASKEFKSIEKNRKMLVMKLEMFVAFSWAVTTTGLDGFYGLCVFCLYREHPKAQPLVVLEKPRIKPVTPGLQGLVLFYYWVRFNINDVSELGAK